MKNLGTFDSLALNIRKFHIFMDKNDFVNVSLLFVLLSKKNKEIDNILKRQKQ